LCKKLKNNKIIDFLEGGGKTGDRKLELVFVDKNGKWYPLDLLFPEEYTQYPDFSSKNLCGVALAWNGADKYGSSLWIEIHLHYFRQCYERSGKKHIWGLVLHN
jgi:hypothetical protein